jgi:L-amino acid N-acyltransferase YncA
VLRAMDLRDWQQVAAIYDQGIATGHATFETEVPSWETWDQNHLEVCRIVAALRSDERTVLGWAALSPVSGRAVYSGVAETSVYVRSDARGSGLGTELLERLVSASERAGLWTLQAGIFPENVASIRIHERCGFRVVGVRRGLGQLDGVWKDVSLLERRSTIVGTNARSQE